MISTLKSVAKLAVPFFIATLASSAFAQAPSNVSIRSIRYAGTGCPAGSVAENLSPDYKAFTLLFDNYVAELGPDVALEKSRRACQIVLDLDFPNGWSYTILDVDYRGYYNLDAGVTGTQGASYYFQGQTATARLNTNYRGRDARDYQIRDSLGLSAVVWSPCGLQRALNINSQVRLTSNSRNARGLMTVDSIDGQLTHVYGLQWRRCN